MALNIYQHLPEENKGSLFAVFPEQELVSLFRGVGDLQSITNKEDVVVYHASYGIRELTPLLLDLDARLVLIYHNITPAKYFIDLDPEFAAGLDYGREELSLLRGKVSNALAVSTFNAQELKSLGYRDVVVAPFGLDPQRLAQLPPSLSLVQELYSRFPRGYLIAISQLLPHKRVEEVVIGTHFLRSRFNIKQGLVIVGTSRSREYGKALDAFTRHVLGEDIWMPGRVSDRELKTILMGASAYVGMSRHEGLSLPLIEAMALGVPVVVRSAGATAETAGEHVGVLADQAGPFEMAQEVASLLSQASLRLNRITLGFQRIEELSLERNLRVLFDLLGVAKK